MALTLILVSLCAVGLIAAGRDLMRAQQRRAEQACPRCGLAFDAKHWTRRNVRDHFQGRYTVTPTYVCPRCGEQWQPPSP